MVKPIWRTTFRIYASTSFKLSINRGIIVIKNNKPFLYLNVKMVLQFEFDDGGREGLRCRNMYIMPCLGTSIIAESRWRRQDLEDML